MAFPIVTPQEMIGQLYVGYFGRAADPVGLNYWVTQFQGGMSLTAIANSFAVQPEATALYSYLAAPTVGDPAAFITAIYQDLFNRGPDAAGLAYWINQLTVQHTPPGQMVLNIISGAQGSDKTTIENKTHVAVDYAQKFVNNNLTWIAIDNIQGAHDVVTPVTFDPLTVTAAILQIDGIITQELTNPQNVQLSPNATSILSGGSVDVVVQEDPSQAGHTVQYTITGIQSSEVKGGQLTGSVTLGTDSKATIHITTVTNAANLNTPNETIKVTVGPISTNVTLTEGTQTVTQTGPVNEGNSFNFNVITAGIANGAANGLTQTYTISGPGLAHIPVAERSGTITLDQNGQATVTVHTLATLPDSGVTTVTVTVGNDAPVNVTINETAVQAVTPSAGTILEGATVVFTVTTSGVAGSAVAGQAENWVLSGAGAAQVDGPLSGSFVLDQNGTATVTVHTLASVLNGITPQDLVITILSGAVPTATNTVHISEGTQVTTNTGPVNEGSAFNFTVATSGVAPGSVAGRVESYTISGLGIDHIPVAERSGTVTLDANGNATVTVHTLADLTGAGTTTVSIAVGNNVASSVTINETATQSVTPSAPTILEGASVVFTINTAGVLGSSVAGQVETWTLSGLAAGQVNGPLSGTVTLDTNGSATVTVATLASVLNGITPQDLVFTLKSGSTTTATASINVSEGSQTTTPSVSAVDEGTAFSFTVATTGVAPGSVAGRVENYTITGPGLSHIPVAERSGTVTLDANGNATITVHTTADIGPLGATSVAINVGNNTAANVTINETAVQSVLINGVSTPVTINQGQALTFTINTGGVLGSAVAGTVETWTLTGTGINQVTGNTLSGTVTLDANGSAVVTVGTDFSIINGPATQNLTFTLKNGSFTAATSALVTINESRIDVTATTPVVEGNQVTYTLSGAGGLAPIPNGTTYTYTLSGDAIGNVIPTSQIHGTVTMNNNTAQVVVNTFSNDTSGLLKNLIFTLDQVPTATATAKISETAPASIVLTTNTDTPGGVPPAANTLGNAAGGNTYFGTADSGNPFTGTTLGQNDLLDGNSNVAGKANTLFLTTKGALLPLLVNNFTTTNIQVFNINAGNLSSAGTTVDMSSTGFNGGVQTNGVQSILDVNSSGSLYLMNVQNPVTFEMQNPSDLGVRTNVGLQYVAGQLANVNGQAGGQQIKLDPTVSPVTGVPNSAFNFPGVTNFTIVSAPPAANPNSTTANGMVSLNQGIVGAPAPFGAASNLFNVTLTNGGVGAVPFVLGAPSSGVVGMAFTGGSNTLDFSGMVGTFFDIGDPGSQVAITSSGNLTMTGGAGGLNSFFANLGTAGNQLGGAGAGINKATILLTGGSFTGNVGTGNWTGQRIVDSASGGSVAISGGAGSGGYVAGANGQNNATILTNNGQVSITGLQGGLGSLTGQVANSWIVTNTTSADGNSVTISGVNGGINEQISTGVGRATINEGGSTGPITLDFSQITAGAGTQTGFHKNLAGNGADFFQGGNSTNSLIIDPFLNNQTSAFGEGTVGAGSLGNLILQSPGGNTWAPLAASNTGGSPVGNGFLNLNTLGQNPTNQITVFIGGTGLVNGSNIFGLAGPITTANLSLTNATFVGAQSLEQFIVMTQATGALAGQVFGFDYNNTSLNTLNFSLLQSAGALADQALTIRDFSATTISAATSAVQNPIFQLNYNSNVGSVINANKSTVTLDNLNAINGLRLFGQNAMTVLALGGAQTLTTINGGDSNINIDALAANYLSTGNTLVGGIPTNTITLGKGTDFVTVNGGSWFVQTGAVPGGGTAGDSGVVTFTLNPGLGNLHIVKSGGGNDDYSIGNQGGIVNLASGAGNDLFKFDMSGIFPGLNSAQTVDGGTGRDEIRLRFGALNENDSLFGHVTNVEILTMALGKFNNSLLLNFFANQSGLDTIQTVGGGSSNVFFEGTGFTNALTYNINVGGSILGDSGGDAIIVAQLPSGTNKITVNATVTDYNVAFETGILTAAINPGTGLPTLSGIFANNNVGYNAATPGNSNTLNLTADGTIANVFGTGLAGIGTNNMPNLNGVANGGASETIFLANNPFVGSKVQTINLGTVTGNTTVWAQTSTLSETITGGTGLFAGGLSTLVGGLAGDTITAQGVLFNWIWGFGGGDTMTGAAGAPGPQTGGATTFVFNTFAELQGNNITNFHQATDSFFINPILLTNNSTKGITYVGFGQTYTDVLQMLQGGGNNPPFGPTNSVYEVDNSTLWVDLDNNGLLNASDAAIHLTFGSPPAPPGSIVFQDKATFNAFSGLSGLGYSDPLNSVIVTVSNIVVVPPGQVLQPGQPLFGTPGLNDTLILSNGSNIEQGNIGLGTIFAFENLTILGPFADVSMAQWNWFRNDPTHTITAVGANDTVIFSNNWAGDPVQTSMFTLQAVENYDFSPLTNTGLTTGITMTTPAYANVFNLLPPGPLQGKGAVLGTTKDDIFQVYGLELANDFEIFGNGGSDTLNVDVNLIFGTVFLAPGVAGSTNAVVLNVQTMNLIGAGPNTVGFNAGTQFNLVNGGAGADTIIDPESLAGAWTVHLAGGANTIQVNATAANLSVGVIDATGGSSNLFINAGAASNTTMSFAEYTLFNTSPILLGVGDTFANTSITFSNAATGGAVLNASVGNWFLASATNNVTIGATAQNVTGVGGADTVNLAAFNITGTLALAGGANHITLTGTAQNISGATITATGGTADLLINAGAASNTTMNFLEYTLFNATGINLGAGDTFANTSITFSNAATGGAVLNANVGNWFLASATNNVTIGAAAQNVTGVGGDDTVNLAAFNITGTLALAAGANHITLTGTAQNISGATITASGGSADLLINAGAASNTTMNFAEYTLFNATAILLGAGDTFANTSITFSNAATGGAVLNANVGNWFLASATNNVTIGAAAQNVTGVGGDDTVNLAAFNITGTLALAAGANHITLTGTAQNISGATITATGGTADLLINAGAASNTTMNFAEYTLFNATAILLGAGDTFANTSITFSNAATGGAVLNANVGNWFLASATNNVTIGATAQNVTGVGGDDTVNLAAFNITGTLALAGGANHITLTGTAQNISGATITATGGTADLLINAGAASNTTMNFLEYTLFNATGINLGAGDTFANTSITFSNAATGGAVLNANVGNWFLASATNNVTLGAAAQNVTGVGGDDTVNLTTFNITGTLALGAGANHVTLTGAAQNISAATITAAGGTADLAINNGGVSNTTMSYAEYQLFNATGITTTGGYGNTTITFSNAVTGGDVLNQNVQNYVFSSGSDFFKLSAAVFDQNVDISSGGNDKAGYQAGVYTGKLTGANAFDTVAFFAAGGISNISGVKSGAAGFEVAGAATGASNADFSNLNLETVIMTLAQHNGFLQPFTGTLNNQTIQLTTDGVAFGDVGIETYFLGQDGSVFGNTFIIGAFGQNVTGRNDNDTVIDNFGGTTGILVGGANAAGGDTLILNTPNTILAVGSKEFENLTLSVANSTVEMDIDFYDGLTGNVVAAGASDTFKLNPGTGGIGFHTSTLAAIENYILADGANAHAYTVAFSGQTVTDLDSTVHINKTTIAAGVDNIKLIATSGALNDIELKGGNTGLDLTTGSGSDFVSVTGGGAITGTLALDGDGGAGNNFFLSDLANIAGLNVTSSKSLLSLVGSANVTISAAEHVLFNASGVFTAGGTDSITVANTASGATALTLAANEDAVEAYFLNGAANTINLSVGNAGGAQYSGNTITLALANGTDAFNINNGAAGVTTGTNNSGNSDTIVNFLSGAGGDTMRLTMDGVLQTFNAGNNYAAVLAADLATLIVNNQIVILNSTILSVANPFTNALAAVDAVVDAWTAANTHKVWASDAGLETVIINTALGAAVFEVHHADKFSVDGAQLIGVLTGVSSDALGAGNFT